MLWLEGLERLRIDWEGEWLGFPRGGGKRRLQRHLRALAGHRGGQGLVGIDQEVAVMVLRLIIPHRFGVVSVSS